MSDPNDMTILTRYVRRIYKILADDYNVNVRTLDLSEVKAFVADYLCRDAMPSTCAMDYYNRHLAKSSEELRYSPDKNYNKFLHGVADYLENEYHIDQRKLAERSSFPQKCWEYYWRQQNTNETAIDYYNNCTGDEIEYMLIKNPTEPDSKPAQQNTKRMSTRWSDLADEAEKRNQAKYIAYMFDRLQDHYHFDTKLIPSDDITEFAKPYIDNHRPPYLCADMYYHKALRQINDSEYEFRDFETSSADLNLFMNQVADELEKTSGIDRNKIDANELHAICMDPNNQTVNQCAKVYLELKKNDIDTLRKTGKETNDMRNVKYPTFDDIDQIEAIYKTEAKRVARARRSSKATQDSDGTVHLGSTDPYLTNEVHHPNEGLDELERHQSVDKQEGAKDSILAQQFLAKCNDQLPKLTNKPTTDKEKETKTMATDNQNAQNAPAAPTIKKIDAVGMMKVKMADAMIKKDGEVDFSKLMMMDAIGDDGKIDLNKVLEAKMNGQIMKAIERGEDLPIEKLMIYQAMQEGKIDYNQIYLYKVVGRLLDDDDKKDADKKAAETTDADKKAAAK